LPLIMIFFGKLTFTDEQNTVIIKKYWRVEKCLKKDQSA